MAYINSTEHQRFIALCKSFIAEHPEKEDETNSDKRMEMLVEDLDRLQLLAEQYKSAFSQLPKLSEDYKNLYRNIRVKIRRLKAKTNI